MKKYLLILLMALSGFVAKACPVCDKQQPKVLQGITHGAGPQSQWDYVIISFAVVIVVITLFYSVKWLFRPDEKAQDHIKQIIINGE
ncbi:MAG TPA: hypothetical protein VGD22_16055 [Sphingobacteriaceae bacterium]